MMYIGTGGVGVTVVFWGDMSRQKPISVDVCV